MSAPLRILAWGAADLGKPRTRITLAGLKKRGVLIDEIFADIWSGIDDKSQIRGLHRKLKIFWRLITAYPSLIWRYCRAPKHDIVFVPYLGVFDVILLWPFAKMRGAHITWDAFLSLYDTVVEDRKLAAKGGLVAKTIWVLEKLASLAADTIALDTKAHAEYFHEQYRANRSKLTSYWVGAEASFFATPKTLENPIDRKFRILFYGQFIPLHGIDHIIEAARACDDPDAEWIMIGRGQEEARIRSLLAENPAPKLEWIDWVDYDDLPAQIARADVCLGVFGASQKAARVIPNKVFQIIASRKALITMDGPGAREIFSARHNGLWLVPPADSDAILRAVKSAKESLCLSEDHTFFTDLAGNITHEAVVLPLIDHVQGAVSGKALTQNRDKRANVALAAEIERHQ